MTSMQGTHKYALYNRLSNDPKSYSYYAWTIYTNAYLNNLFSTIYSDIHTLYLSESIDALEPYK